MFSLQSSRRCSRLGVLRCLDVWGNRWCGGNRIPDLFYTVASWWFCGHILRVERRHFGVEVLPAGLFSQLS